MTSGIACSRPLSWDGGSRDGSGERVRNAGAQFGVKPKGQANHRVLSARGEIRTPFDFSGACSYPSTTRAG